MSRTARSWTQAPGLGRAAHSVQQGGSSDAEQSFWTPTLVSKRPLPGILAQPNRAEQRRSYMHAPLQSLDAADDDDEDFLPEQRAAGSRKRRKAAVKAQPQSTAAAQQQDDVSRQPRQSARRQAVAKKGTATDFFLPLAQRKQKKVVPHCDCGLGRSQTRDVQRHHIR